MIRLDIFLKKVPWIFAIAIMQVVIFMIAGVIANLFHQLIAEFIFAIISIGGVAVIAITDFYIYYLKQQNKKGEANDTQD